MEKANINPRVLYLTRMAVLIAIVVVLTVFNIGNIPIGPVVATIYQVPIVIGAVLLGPAAGSILGGIWGLLCFYLAITGQTTDVIALAAIQQNVFIYFIIAFVPRLLTGLLSGYIYLLFKKLFKDKKDVISFGITGILGSLCNTVLYLGALYIFVKDIIADKLELALNAVAKFVMTVALTNGLIEAALCCIIVIGVCKALRHFKVA